MASRRERHVAKVSRAPVPQHTEADAMPPLRQPNSTCVGVQSIPSRNQLFQRAGRQLECRPISRFREVGSCLRAFLAGDWLGVRMLPSRSVLQRATEK